MDSNVIILDLDDDDESQDDQIAETTRKVNVSQQQYDRIETFYHGIRAWSFIVIVGF